MKKILLLILLIVVSISAFTIEPNWLRNVPLHQSALYECIVVQGRGLTKEEADREVENKIQRIVHDRTGTDYAATIRLSPYSTYYTRDYDGMILVSCLYVVAVNAEDFRASKEMNQGVPKGTHSGIINDIKPSKKKNEKPEYWERYRTNIYVSEFRQAKCGGADKEELVHDLYDQAALSLKDKVHLPNEYYFFSSVHYDHYYSKEDNNIYVVACIQRERITEYYLDITNQRIRTIKNYLASAHDKELVPPEHREWLTIRTLYEKVSQEANAITDSILPGLRIYGADQKQITIIEQTLRESIRSSEEGINHVRKDANTSMVPMLNRWLNIAYKAETEEYGLSTALQYYYGSLIYWEQYIADDNPDVSLSYMGTKHKGAELKRWLEMHLKEILKNVRVYCVRKEKTEGDIHFFWPGMIAVSNVAYYTNTGNGNSNIRYSASGTNCWVRWQGTPDNIQVGLDYNMSDWIGDASLKQVLESDNNKSRFINEAIHIVPIIEEDEYKGIVQSNNLSTSVVSVCSEPTAINTNSIYVKTDSITQEYEVIEITDSKKVKGYNKILASVCDAINAHNISIIKTYFTENGYEMLRRLVAKNEIKARYNECTFLKCWDEVYARSIPMTITYATKKEVAENVVFVFNHEEKIDGIQFALDKETIRDINGHKGWSLYIKYAIVNFIENYRTAYALKRLDYISELFADDAIIIIGRVFKKPEEFTDGVKLNTIPQKPHVRYTTPTKQQYMRNLARNFSNNEWINIRFLHAQFVQPGGPGAYYGMSLQQEYSSQHYCDNGYLFLVVELDSVENPVIQLRAWTPDGSFGWSDYERLLNKKRIK